VAQKPTTTPSLPTAEDAGLSPEVQWFLETRGIPIPDCPPLHKTPEPRDHPGAQFDGERVDRVLRAFRLLRHTQGEWAGRPLIPDPWQVAYILAPVFGWVHQDDSGQWVRIIRSLYVDVPRKNGKGIDITTSILTGAGWKKFGDLTTGDQVHALDGSLTRVTFVSPVRELSCYRVTFGDGQSVVCDEDHLWSVWDRYREKWRTVPTPELFATHRAGSRQDTRYSVRMDRIIERPAVDLPMDPYLLGTWLGDGHTDAARITTPDEDVWRAFETIGGYDVRRIGSTEITYGIRGGFLVALRELGILGAKRIPPQYLTGSVEQRLALLQGLMDTDGGVLLGESTPRVEFSTTNPDLAEGVLFLARSLGWKPTSTQGVATLYGKDCGPKWRVTWTAHADRPPFRLPRHTDKLYLPPARSTRSQTNMVVSVERVPTVPTRCIAVEHPSRQFLVGDGLIPTHNTTLCGGIAVYLTAADGEAGAQVLAAATTQQQAGYVFDPIKHLCQNSPALRPHIKAFSKRIVHNASGSYFGVVSSVAEALHGANVHGAVIDELHVHSSGELVETIETGTGSRRQPLVAIITTADDGRQGTIYARKRERIERLARGVITDATSYGVVWAAEPDDDPFEEATWRKANPGFGISPTRAFLAMSAQAAKDSPVNLASFQRLHLGIRTKQATRFFDLDLWDRNAGMVDESKLKGRVAYGGLDLASTSDLCALGWVFPDMTGGHDIVVRCWAPERAFDRINERSAGAAEVWRREGWLTVTPGDVADYDYIRQSVNADRELFDVREIGYDPWNATQLVNDLQADSAPMVTVRQGFGSMSPPTKDLLRLLLEGTADKPRLRHGGNPCLRWQADNFAVEMDPAGNVKPSKRHAGDKIDGIVAVLIALSRAAQHQPARRSAYEDRDLEIL